VVTASLLVSHKDDSNAAKPNIAMTTAAFLVTQIRISLLIRNLKQVLVLVKMKRKGIFINMSMQFYRWLQGTEIAINHKLKW